MVLLTSFDVTSYNLPGHLIGLSIIDGCSLDFQPESFCDLSFLDNLTFILDLDGVNYIRAYVAVPSMTSSTHLACTCVVVVMVKSSIWPLLGGCLTYSLVFGPPPRSLYQTKNCMPVHS